MFTNINLFDSLRVPSNGLPRDGGIRFGEMEHDAFQYNSFNMLDYAALYPSFMISEIALLSQDSNNLQPGEPATGIRIRIERTNTEYTTMVNLTTELFTNAVMRILNKIAGCNKSKYKIIDKSKNTECPITYEPIKYGDVYLTCVKCKYNFGKKAINQYFSYCDKIPNCPMCREDWLDFCNYVNRDKKKEKTFKLLIAFSKISNKTFKSNIKCDINTLIYGYPSYTKHNKKWFYGK